jgi:hypothetical protein
MPIGMASARARSGLFMDSGMRSMRFFSMCSELSFERFSNAFEQTNALKLTKAGFTR